jgi:tRNA A-37 threonylcarbamoyl transferase component Bud32
MTTIARSLPIPKVDEHPLLDHQGVSGYRLGYLIRLDQDELLRRLPEVRKAVHQLHEAGFPHGDSSPSNITKTQDGTIVLIGFGYAGKIGTQASSSVPHWVYEDAIVTVQADQRALERISKLIERT